MRRLFRALLRLFPSDFRGDYGAEMEEVFGDELSDAAGRRRRARVVGRNAGAMARQGLVLHAQQAWQDAGYAFRTLRVSPLASVVATSALAFGIGASVLTFTVADAFLFKPLPYADPARLVHVWGADRERDAPQQRVSLQEADAWQARTELFEDVALFNYSTSEWLADPRSERVSSGLVSANLFDLLGIAPIRGRGFESGDDQPGAAPVMLLSEELWRSRFGGSPHVVGTTLEIDGERRQVVGILPAGIMFPLPTTRIWMPRTLDRERYTAAFQPFQVVARLRDGVSRDEAAAALADPMPGLVAAYPDLAGRSATVVPLREALNFAYDVFSAGALVMGLASLLVLLTACANISSLMLSRAIRRGREVAIRAAIGASRFRLVRQFLVESLVLSAIGTAAGTLLAAWGARLLGGVVPDDLHRAAALAVDVRAVLVAAALAAIAAVAFGLAPAVRFARVNLGDAMRQDGGGGTTSRASLRLQSWLVQGQVMLSVVLLVGTVLVARSFVALSAIEPGFDAGGVLSLQISLPSARYPDRAAVARFHDALRLGAEAVPGVAVATTVNFLPLNHETETVAFAPDGEPFLSQGPRREAAVLTVAPGYFDVLRIAILEGRGIDAADRDGQIPAAVINESLAAGHFGGGSAVGRTIRLEGRDQPFTVVGVVADTRHQALDEPPGDQIYVAQAQRAWSYLRLLARTDAAPLSLDGPLRDVVDRIDPQLSVAEVRPLQDVVDAWLMPQRGLSVALLALGGFALWLALFGIYGIVTCFVADRTRELGVRVALGADERLIVRHVLARGLRLAGRGAVAGLILSIGASVAMRGMLFGVGVGDPVTYAMVVALVVIVATLAGLLPARRAARVSPLVAMKAG